MQYMLMICDEETQQKGPGDPGFEEIMAEYAAFSEVVEKLGRVRGGGPPDAHELSNHGSRS